MPEAACIRAKEIGGHVRKNMQYSRILQNGLFGLRFDQFEFFDNTHPMRATNSLIGEKMVALSANASFLTSPPHPR
jgi:hypothetical protein